MGIGREVADAYIQVHGDLKKFRKSLAGAAKDGKAMGMDAADSFSAGWDKRTEANFAKKWDGIMDSLHSNKKVDWNRLVGTFDAKGFADAKSKINSFLAEAAKNEIITEKEYQKARKAVKATMDLMRDEHELALKQDKEKKKLRERDLAFKEATKQAIKDARVEQEKYNKSFAGMFENNRLREVENGFRRITKAMGDGDWSKFTEGEFHLHKVGKQVKETVDEMKSLGRVTDEEGDRITAAVRGHIDAEVERRNALALTAEQTRKNKEEQERYNRSFEGMLEGDKLKEMEDRFKAISKAMATGNWGPLAKDHDTVRQFRKEVMRTAEQMQSTGRISEESFNRIGESVRRASRDQANHNIELKKSRGNFLGLGKVFDKLKGSWSNMDKTVKLVLTLIAAAAGPIATLGSGLASGAMGLVSSLGMAAGALVPLIAGAGAFALGIGLAVSALDDVRARFPGIDTAMQGIGATWKHQAGEFGKEWGASLEGLLSSFNDKLARTDFGTPFGKAAAEITNAFTDVVNGPGFNALLRAMETDLPAAMSGIGRGLAGLAGGLASLFAGAAPAAKALGEDFAGWGAKISASLEKARESGKLNEVFMKAREALLHVLDAAGSVGSALGTMFMIGSDSGNRMLESLTRVTDKFNEWMHTEEGRASMTQWFENGERIMRAMEPVAVGLATALNGLVTDYSIGQFENLMVLVGDILPILGELLGVISDLGILNILAEAIKLVGVFLEPLLPPLKDLAQTIGPAVQDMLIELQPAFAELGEALVPVIEAIAEMAVELMPQLIPVITDLVTELVPLISNLGEVLDFLLDLGGTDGAVSEVGTRFEGMGNMISGAVEVINGALDILIGLFTGDWDRVWKGAGEVFDGTVTNWEGTIQSTFGGVGQAFLDFAGTTGETLGTWSTDAAAKFTEVKETVGTFAAESTEKLMTWGADLGHKLVELPGESFALAKEGWNIFKEDTTTVIGDMGTKVNETLDGMWQKFDEVFPGTRQLASDEWAELSATLATGTENIKTNLGTAWDEMSTKVGEKVTEMTGNAETGYNILKDKVTGKLGEMKANSDREWGELSSKAGEHINNFKTGAENSYSELERNTKAYGNLISEASNRVWTNVSDYTREKLGPMVRDVQSGYNNMKNDASNRLNELKDNASRSWNNMVSNGSEIMGRLGESVRQGVQTALDFIIRLPNRMVDAVQNPSLLIDAGRGIMQGFYNGLKAIWGNVQNFVGDVAAWIRDHKGPISYDKVLLEPAGKAIMSGLLVGLEKKMPDLEREVQSITDTLAGAVSADLVDSTASGARSIITALAAEFDSSKTYVFGLDAAAGLADGLSKGASLVKSAYGDLAAPEATPGVFTYRPAAKDTADAESSGGKNITIESGAIRLESNVSDPELAADKVLDGLVTILP